MRLCASSHQQSRASSQRHVRGGSWHIHSMQCGQYLKKTDSMEETYGGILGIFCSAALKCDAVALMLETLRGDETLDLRSLRVWLRALFLGLNLTTDDELANL
jgi:hypothetical protein